SRLNVRAGQRVRVGPLLMQALEVALRAAELTDGDVDPTVGRALELAGYDRDWRRAPPPAEEPGPRGPIVARLLAGYRTVRLDRRSFTVSLPAGIRLDL